MKPTDTSEKGLESIIVASLVEEAGYVQGDSQDYDREYAVDLSKLLQFLATTQPETYAALGISQEGSKRTKFLHRLQGEIAKRGVLDVLRSGIKHGPADVSLFYGTPTPGNLKAEMCGRTTLRWRATTAWPRPWRTTRSTGNAPISPL